MKIRMIGAIAALGLVGLAGPASADHIRGAAHSNDNAADFAWHINSKGHLIIVIGNKSSGSAAVTSLTFDHGDGGSIAAMLNVKGKFRFLGDFSRLEKVKDVQVRFTRNKRDGKGKHDYGWGCRSGCGVSELPEPGMLVLFGMGLIGIGLVWRRRKKRSTDA